MEKRRHKRIKVVNCFADLSDGFGFFAGIVSDISRNGLLLNDVPQKLNNQSKKLTVIVSKGGRNFRITAIPKWVNENIHNKSMGVEILNAPVAWFAFIDQHEPKEIDGHIWAGVSLRN